jgi:hypothetical protein
MVIPAVNKMLPGMLAGSLQPKPDVKKVSADYVAVTMLRHNEA